MDVGAHEVLSILGPNGAGKSTLLKCINGLLKTKKGTVFVDGEDTHQLKRGSCKANGLCASTGGCFADNSF